MELIINISTDNAAFEDNPNELQAILKQVTDKLDLNESCELHLRDTNGNKVGLVQYGKGCNRLNDEIVGSYCTEASMELFLEACKNVPTENYYENDKGEEIAICEAFEHMSFKELREHLGI